MQYEYIFKKLSKMVRKLFSNGIWIIKNSKKKYFVTGQQTYRLMSLGLSFG
jgi:hypothetical protein